MKRLLQNLFSTASGPAYTAMAFSESGYEKLPTKSELNEEVARPDVVGVRQAWSAETAVAGLTPDRLAAILRRCDQGDMDAFLTLAEEMEERDPHYGSVLQTRKLAVTGLDRQLAFAPGQDQHPKAAEILEACQTLVADDAMDDLAWHLLDAIAKGYAAPEIAWDTTAERWRPKGYEWRDPRWFQFDRETGRELRLKATGAIDGEALPPMKFVVALANRKSGLPARGGLARLVAFSFVCKLYGLKDWMAYAEIFGIPLRLGKYDAAAKPEDVEVLKRAVFGLGSDAAAVIPQAMTIEFPNLGAATGGAELFMMLVDWCDTQVSKAVLGQAGTTDMKSGGGYAQSKVLNEVRGDLTKADAKWIGVTITRGVIEPFVRVNWGPDAPAPAAIYVVEEPEDVAALTAALDKLVPLGLEVDQDEIRKKLRLSKPAAGASVLRPPAVTIARPKEAAGGLASEEGRLGQLRRRRLAVEDDLDEITAAALDGWAPAFGGEVAEVLAIVEGAESFDAILERLEALAANIDAPAAARSLARAMFLASATGDAAIREG